MKIISGYVWQDEKDAKNVKDKEEAKDKKNVKGDSILLKQLRYGRCPILFGCICDSLAGGYITGRLIQWFYTKGVDLCRRASSDNKIEKELMAAWQQVTLEVKQYSDKTGIGGETHITALLIIGKRFWLMWKGNVKGYVLNRRFHRPNMRLLTTEAGMYPQIVSGVLQKGIGILLCGADFSENLSEEVIRDCLAVQEIESGQQISRRLGELWEESGKRGRKRVQSAIYVQTK